MPVRVFFDTNVLIYAVSKGDPRNSVAEELLEAGGVLSVPILNEFASVARRKMLMPWADVREALDAFVVLCPAPLSITMDIHEGGIRIAEKYRYNIYDALVVSAALAAGCPILYSEDLQDGQTVEGLSIKNPFGKPRG